MTDSIKKKRGFAAMSPERHREIAAMGGRATPAASRSFAKDSAFAAACGRIGGKNLAPEKRAFSKNPALAVAAGRKGGLAVGRREATP